MGRSLLNSSEGLLAVEDCLEKRAVMDEPPASLAMYIGTLKPLLRQVATVGQKRGTAERGDMVGDY
jgi:hypothetical protein